MQKNFWLERWQKNETGFHQGQVNTHLETWWKELEITLATQVLVPLCGKSHDMIWLLKQGYQVLGIELSEIAVKDFFTENKLEPEITQQGSIQCYTVDNLAILCGDIFSVTKEQLKNITAVYDRAALIALPPEMRQQYADHLKNVLPKETQSLLITMDYDQTEMSGPPFSVNEEEVHQLFTSPFRVEKLSQKQILTENDPFKERGLTSLIEKVYRLST